MVVVASRQADAEIEITPAMIKAGVEELREKQIGLPLDEIVLDVFYAMVFESKKPIFPPRL